MMERTESESVFHHGLAPRLRVRDNVCCAKEFLVPKPAEGALVLVRLKHTFSERSLVKSHANHRGDVIASCAHHIISDLRRSLLTQCDNGRIVDCDAHRQVRWIITHNVYGPGR